MMLKDKSFPIILIGIITTIVASIFFYFGIRSTFAYVTFAIGFLLVGIGILLGFAKMVSEEKEEE